MIPEAASPERRRRIVFYVSRREYLRARRVLRTESVGGILVMIAAVAGFALANSPLSDWYFSLRDTRIGPAPLHLDLTIAQWSADGLLAVFFFLVGLELKREFAEGVLSRFSTAIVPVVAAIGGVIVPALIYLAVNAGHDSAHGWAIPTATDIAFAVAVLAIIAPGVPLALRVFLLTLAVVDDLIAIAIIAVFYSEGISLLPLVGSLAMVGLYALLARSLSGWYERRAPAAWFTLLPVGLVAWALMHESGVHATIAGVLLAFVVPRRLAESFGHRFGPISAAFAVPLFALFAAGVPLSADSGFPFDLIAIGIMLGLVIGKPLGIVLSTAILVKFTRARLGADVALRDLIGVGALAGIGFTVSMLIVELSFTPQQDIDTARLSVMVASLIAVAFAALLLRRGGNRKQNSSSL